MHKMSCTFYGMLHNTPAMVTRAAASARDSIQKHTCFIGTGHTPRGGHDEKCPSGSGEHFSTESQEFVLKAWVNGKQQPRLFCTSTESNIT